MVGARGPAPARGKRVSAVLAFAFLGGVILNLMPCVFPHFFQGPGLLHASREDLRRTRAQSFFMPPGVDLLFGCCSLYSWLCGTPAGRLAGDFNCSHPLSW